MAGLPTLYTTLTFPHMSLLKGE